MTYATNDSEVRTFQSPGLREIARKIALDLLGKTTQWFPDTSLQNKPRVQFMYFHHIFKDEERGFERLLAQLAQNFTFISYSEAVQMVINGTADKPYMAFSSDDGFKNNLVAARILGDFGATVCFFLNPGTFGFTDPEAIRQHCCPARQTTFRVYHRKGHGAG
jgi:hypothetical protein